MDEATVYFSVVADGGPPGPRPCDGRVFAVDKPTGAMRTLADTGCRSIRSLAVDDRDVYVNNVRELPAYESRIFRIPKSGGEPELVQEPKPYRVTALAVDANALYWTGDYSRMQQNPGEIGVVVRVPKR